MDSDAAVPAVSSSYQTRASVVPELFPNMLTNILSSEFDSLGLPHTNLRTQLLLCEVIKHVCTCMYSYSMLEKSLKASNYHDIKIHDRNRSVLSPIF